MDEPFVPATFGPPVSLEGDGFRLEPLGPEHNDRDHVAWMSSIDHIRSTPGFPDGKWPAPMSRKANLRDLERHARDFEQRTGFTYSVLDGEEVIGCVYIYPPENDSNDAAVSSWVRQSRSDLDLLLWQDVSAWLRADWPFGNPRYAPRADA
jgi:hypothetical protein